MSLASNICVLVVLDQCIKLSIPLNRYSYQTTTTYCIYLIIIQFKPDEMETLLARFSNCEIRGKCILNPAMTDTRQVSHRLNPRDQQHKYKRNITKVL